MKLKQRKNGDPFFAFQLWERWFETNGDPYTGEYYHSQCFFCGSSSDEQFTHLPDCVYVEACKLVGVECK